MCGIIGYVGPRPAAQLLLDGLKRMEYRGYDSAGLAVVNGHGLVIEKAAGKLDQLEEKVKNRLPEGTLGIGHTRWATHGAPTTGNAHPHTDQHGKIAIIHNGIIENAGAIRTLLQKRGHSFRSETDTEVLAHLIGTLYQGDLEEAVAAALREVDGAYGIAVVSADEPDTIVAARKGSPLIVGVGEGDLAVHDARARRAQHLPQLRLRPHRSERPGGGAHHRDRLEPERALGPRTARPVDGVLQAAGDRAVVLRRRDEQGVRPRDRVAQARHLNGRLRSVEVLVIGRHVAHAVPDLEPGALRHLARRGAQEPAVVGVRAQAPGDPENDHR